MTYVNIMMEFLGYDLAFTGIGKGDPPIICYYWMKQPKTTFRPLQIDFLFPVHCPHGLFVKPENSIISVN